MEPNVTEDHFFGIHEPTCITFREIKLAACANVYVPQKFACVVRTMLISIQESRGRYFYSR